MATPYSYLILVRNHLQCRSIIPELGREQETNDCESNVLGEAINRLLNFITRYSYIYSTCFVCPIPLVHLTHGCHTACYRFRGRQQSHLLSYFLLSTINEIKKYILLQGGVRGQQSAAKWAR